MKLLEVHVHFHEIDVCHMLSRSRRIMNEFLRFVELVEHFNNIGGKFMNWLGTFMNLSLHFCEVILPKEYVVRCGSNEGH